MKSGQQLLREQKISKHLSCSRTQSECEISNQGSRLSAASSRTSIAAPGLPLDFDQIKDDIDDLAVNKEKLASRTNLQVNIVYGLLLLRYATREFLFLCAT